MLNLIVSIFILALNLSSVNFLQDTSFINPFLRYLTPVDVVATSDSFYAPILMYHHISSTMVHGPYVVTPEMFSRQMTWLHDNGYNVISYSRFYYALATKTQVPPNSVVISFDDNDKDQYINALPILKKYGYTAIFFIPTAYIGVRGGVMTWDMLKDLVKNNMEIGSHSVTHPDLTKIPKKQLYSEVTVSKNTLQEHLGIPIQFFAYPGGAKTPSVVKAVQEAGYLSAVSTIYLPTHSYKEDRYRVARIYVGNDLQSFVDFIHGRRLNEAH